jgi:CRP-like cAMP-binding protein
MKRLDSIDNEMKQLLDMTFSSMFIDINESLLSHLNAGIFAVEYDNGEAIVAEGSEGQDFYIIYEGQVKVVRHGEEIDILKKGDFFGEMALLFGDKRMATVLADGTVKCLVLPKLEFDILTEKDRDFKKMVETYAQARQTVNN